MSIVLPDRIACSILFNHSSENQSSRIPVSPSPFAAQSQPRYRCHASTPWKVESPSNPSSRLLLSSFLSLTLESTILLSFSHSSFFPLFNLSPFPPSLSLSYALCLTCHVTHALFSSDSAGTKKERTNNNCCSLSSNHCRQFWDSQKGEEKEGGGGDGVCVSYRLPSPASWLKMPGWMGMGVHGTRVFDDERASGHGIGPLALS